MDARRQTLGSRSWLTVVSTFAIIGLMGGEAAAACFNPLIGGKPVLGNAGLASLAMAAVPAMAGTEQSSSAAGAQSAQGAGPIVGLWQNVLTATDAMGVPLGTFDFGFQQFHGDGTELMISGGVPPTIGNVCIGAWERRGNGVIKLRHVTWNWRGGPPVQDLGESPTGYFLLIVELRVNRRGTRYSGTWTTGSYDLGVPMPVDIVEGEAQPGTFFEGTTEGVRISVD